MAYDDWLLVRELVDHVVKVHESPDLSIWGEYLAPTVAVSPLSG